MRLLLVTPFYPAHGGGVERVAERMATLMAASGVEVTWCASDVDGTPALAGIRCEPMAGSNVIERLSGFPYPLWRPSALAHLTRLARAADAVHVHDCIYLGNLVASRAAVRQKRPLVVTQHIGEKPLPMPLKLALGLAYRVGVRLALAPARGVAFISPAGLHHFEHMAGVHPHWHHVPNGVDTACFHPVDTLPSALRAALGMDPARPLMLFVGRFVPTKRLPLLREMARLRPQWQWCVVGHGPERPQDWGLPQVQVRPSMSQAQLAALYRAADLLVLPSHGEGFPLVVQEAMACGLPACITPAVAEGGAMPDSTWLPLPEVAGDAAATARAGVNTIDDWLSGAAPIRTAQRAACATHARQAWNWQVSVATHLGWLAANGTAMATAAP